MNIYSCTLFGCVPTLQDLAKKVKRSKSVEKYMVTKTVIMTNITRRGWLQMTMIPSLDMTFNDYYVNTLLHTLMLLSYGWNIP